MAYDYDLFVIGGGSGGVRAARFTAPLGFKVGLAEEYRMGGTCVIRGCVPKKLLSYASHGFEDVADLAGYGFDARVDGFSWERLIAAKDKEINRLEGAYQNTLKGAGVEWFKARAHLTDAHTIVLRDTETGDEKTVTADKILLATGGYPTVPQCRAVTWPSRQTKPSTSKHCRSASLSMAAAISRLSSLASLQVWARRRIWFIAASNRCAALTRIYASSSLNSSITTST